MDFEPKDLIQIDATIITGILIFFSIGYTLILARSNTGAALIVLTFLNLIPFLISAIIALFGFTKAPRIFTGLGFVGLLIEFTILVLFPIDLRLP